MHRVIPSERSPQAAEEACRNCRKAFFINGGDIFQANALILAEPFPVIGRAADMVSPAIIAGNSVPLRSHACGQFFHDDLHAALSGRDALVSHHCDSHISSPAAD